MCVSGGRGEGRGDGGWVFGEGERDIRSAKRTMTALRKDVEREREVSGAAGGAVRSLSYSGHRSTLSASSAAHRPPLSSRSGNAKQSFMKITLISDAN